MPYKSQKQERYFHWAAEHGKIPEKTVEEFDHASKGLKLPKHAEQDDEEKKKHFASLSDYLDGHKS